MDPGIAGLTDCIEIGSGGFGAVYAATEERFGRRVAVKLLFQVDGDGRRRFEREQLTMGRMTGHPNVVTPHSSGYTDTGLPYLIMEYVPGGSLADVLATHGPLHWRQAVGYVLPIADALGYGHAQGILHRDVKPANILLAEGPTTKLADFGIASIRAAAATQAVAFTMAHAPPETFAGGTDQRDERSDLYSLASTLYTLVSGRTPFHRGDPDSQLAHMARIAEHPVTTLPGVPAPLNRFFTVAMAKAPADRPTNAVEFAEQLRSVVATTPDLLDDTIVAPRPTPARPEPPSSTPPPDHDTRFTPPTPGWFEPVAPAIGHGLRPMPFERPLAPRPSMAPQPGETWRPALTSFGTTFMAVLAVGSGLAGFSAAVIVGALLLATVVGFLARASAQTLPPLGQRLGGIPFHELRMRRRDQKSGDWFRGQ